MTADQIADQYGLSLSQVYAALAYYHDNREEIDQSIRADEQFAAELKGRTTSELSGKSGG